VVKLVPHFVIYPADICFLPITLLFGYIHGLIKLYPLFALHVVRLAMLSSLILYCSRKEHGKEEEEEEGMLLSAGI
jgi:hypothetical protein